MLNRDIEKLIPHRGRLKLIDGIIETDDKKATCFAVVNERWPLYENGEVSSIILIELIAQTIGIGAGHKKYRETGKGAHGYLVGIKNARFNSRKIISGTRLIIKTVSAYDHEKYAVFKGSVENESGDILCDMEIQLYSPE